MKKILFAVFLTLAAFATAHAGDLVAGEPTPLFSMTRLQLGAGANYEFYSQSGSQAAALPGFDKEWTVGLYGAYNIVPSLDFIGFTKLGLDNHVFNSALGLRMTLFAGSK